MNSGLCTVGLHTHDLHYLDPEAKKPVFLLPDNETLFDDGTKKGIDCLEKQLDIEVKYFAYPYGFGTLEPMKSLFRIKYPTFLP